MGTKYIQGFFKPKNPEKYKGDVKEIVYRSSYELKFLMMLDNDPNVINYSSEEIIIPYKDYKNNLHRYFVDFYVKKKVDDEIVEQLIEIKPFVQTQPPNVSGKKKKTVIKEVLTYETNQAKWTAARKYCEKKGWEFLILNEYDLGIKQR